MKESGRCTEQHAPGPAAPSDRDSPPLLHSSVPALLVVQVTMQGFQQAMHDRVLGQIALLQVQREQGSVKGRLPACLRCPAAEPALPCRLPCPGPGPAAQGGIDLLLLRRHRPPGRELHHARRRSVCGLQRSGASKCPLLSSPAPAAARPPTAPTACAHPLLLLVPCCCPRAPSLVRRSMVWCRRCRQSTGASRSA